MRIHLALCSLILLPAIPAVAGPTRQDIASRNATRLMRAYPAASIKRGEEGTVKVAFKVNRKGGVDGCEITASSGYSALDKAACDVFLTGATAKPRRSGDGRRITSTETATLQWKLPASATRPDTPPVMDTKIGQAGEAYFCRRHLRTGSLIIEDKICLTASDLAQATEYARQQTIIWQTPLGPLY